MQPVVKSMGRLGMIWVTVISTVASAFLSACVAIVLGIFIEVPNYTTHITLAFIIPFFVTPIFSWMTAIALRDSRQARIKAYELARLDPLTGLLNRRAFFEANERSRETRAPTATRSLLFIDIDHFKKINDSHGHEGGDRVLREFAKIVVDTVRKSDLVARFGGEEFVIETGEATPEDAKAVAQRILQRARAHQVAYRGKIISYTVSIGIAHGDYSCEIDPLLSAADAQLYLAKRAGRDCYRCDAPPNLFPAPSAVMMDGRRRAVKFA